MIEDRDMKTIKIIAGAAAALLFLLTAACCLSVTLADGGLLPAFLPFEGYAVQSDSLGGLLPGGSLAIVDPDAALEAGHVAMLFAGTTAVADGEGMLIDPEAPEVAYEAADAAGRVVYRIAGLGALLALLQQGKLIVWAVLAVVLIGALLWMAAAPKRRRKKEIRELIELFDYYGRKYDAEEEGIDY